MVEDIARFAEGPPGSMWRGLGFVCVYTGACDADAAKDSWRPPRDTGARSQAAPRAAALARRFRGQHESSVRARPAASSPGRAFNIIECDVLILGAGMTRELPRPTSSSASFPISQVNIIELRSSFSY